MNDLISNDVMAHKAKNPGYFRIALCACLYAGDWGGEPGWERRGRRGRVGSILIRGRERKGRGSREKEKGKGGKGEGVLLTRQSLVETSERNVKC